MDGDTLEPEAVVQCIERGFADQGYPGDDHIVYDNSSYRLN
jgi:hypothetical protein